MNDWLLASSDLVLFARVVDEGKQLLVTMPSDIARRDFVLASRPALVFSPTVGSGAESAAGYRGQACAPRASRCRTGG